LLFFLAVLGMGLLTACPSSTGTDGAPDAPPFTIELEEINCPTLPGLQSFSWAADGLGKFLLIGGRTTGLHQRQPFASFGSPGRSDSLYVIEPASCSKWAYPLDALPVPLAEHLAVSNGQAGQHENHVYFVGGYGYSPSFDEHITYPYLTVIDVEATIAAIVSGDDPVVHMRQSVDPRLAVTGGHLHRLDTTWYLVGGQFFDGRYNPHGPDHGPGFVQRYTDAVAHFGIRDRSVDVGESAAGFVLTGYQSDADSLLMHRRDLNVVPQVFPDGNRGLTAFSGVFRHEGDLDLPWESAVDIRPDGMRERSEFAQKLNHYHSACLPIHSARDRSMHTLFFGGIARFTYDTASNALIDDEEVPFVKTISLVSRDRKDRLSESAFDARMPGYLGANMAFLADPDAPFSEDGILDLNALPVEGAVAGTAVGWLYGGIESSAPHIFWVDDGTLSVASNRLFRVKIKPVK
jgi:hypothetical protein